MTNFTLKQQDAECMRHCISDLLGQLTIAYQQAKSERRELAAASAPPDETFSVLEELELLTSDLRGYASQVQMLGKVGAEEAAIAHLQSLRLFGFPGITRFYFETERGYPKLKDYIRQLDYLRLLLLEYLQARF